MGSAGFSSYVDIRSSPLQVASFAAPIGNKRGGQGLLSRVPLPMQCRLETGDRANVHAMTPNSAAESPSRLRWSKSLGPKPDSVGSLVALVLSHAISAKSARTFFSNASSFCTLARCSMRLKCATQFLNTEVSTFNAAPRRKHQ